MLIKFGDIQEKYAGFYNKKVFTKNMALRQTSINYDWINGSIERIRNIPHISGIRFGPPIGEDGKIYIEISDRLIGIYIKGKKLKITNLNLQQAFDTLDEYYKNR